MAAPRTSLIFDLDGTLIDSAPDIAFALNELLAELDCAPLSLEAVRALIGDGAPILLARALDAGGAVFEPETYESLIERYRTLYLDHATVDTTVYAGVPETLELLRSQGYRMVVCTNKLQHSSLHILEAYDLARYFDGVAGGDVVPARKPDPGHLLAALKLIGGGPEQAVMIGDGINDVTAAKAAGIPVLVLPSGYGEIEAAALGGDLLLADFAEIPAALESFA
jgi:phosphoglycolate phosphatase